MIKKKVRKCKNPFTNTNDVKDYISKNSIYFKKIGEGDYGRVYRFKLDNKIILNSKILLLGDYTLKLLKYSDDYYNINQIDYLTKLSKYGLIPKIFIITKNYTISKFIDGYTFDEVKYMYYDDNKISQKVWLNIIKKREYILDIWDKLGFNHGDHHNNNILVSKDFNHVYFIDPNVVKNFI